MEQHRLHHRKATSRELCLVPTAQPWPLNSKMDLITENYLCGQWPRDKHSFMSDKSTQTPGFWIDEVGGLKIHRRSASWSSTDHREELIQIGFMDIAKLRLQLCRTMLGIHHNNEKEDEPDSLFNQIQTKQLPASSIPVTKPAVCRESSINDGINWELESVFISDTWARQQERELLDGRCAPVPPHQNTDFHMQVTDSQPCSKSLSGPHISPFTSNPTSDRPHLGEGCISVNDRSSPLPLLASSPKPNNSFTFKRVPPEGCEKVKVFEDIAPCRSRSFPVFSCPDKNKVSFIPNASGPFCPVKQYNLPPVTSDLEPGSRSVWTVSLLRQVGVREDILAPCYSTYRLHC